MNGKHFLSSGPFPHWRFYREIPPHFIAKIPSTTPLLFFLLIFLYIKIPPQTHQRIKVRLEHVKSYRKKKSRYSLLRRSKRQVVWGQPEVEPPEELHFLSKNVNRFHSIVLSRVGHPFLQQKVWVSGHSSYAFLRRGLDKECAIQQRVIQIPVLRLILYSRSTKNDSIN